MLKIGNMIERRFQILSKASNNDTNTQPVILAMARFYLDVYAVSTDLEVELETMEDAVESLQQLASLGERQLLILEEVDDLGEEHLHVLAGEHEGACVVATVERGYSSTMSSGVRTCRQFGFSLLSLLHTEVKIAVISRISIKRPI